MNKVETEASQLSTSAGVRKAVETCTHGTASYLQSPWNHKSCSFDLVWIWPTSSELLLVPLSPAETQFASPLTTLRLPFSLSERQLKLSGNVVFTHNSTICLSKFSLNDSLQQLHIESY